MHRFKFTPDDLFINRLKTYPEYNVFIYQGRMYVNNETQPSTADGLVVYDINRNKTPLNAISPFVMSGSEKNAFKSQQYQPLVKDATGEHFLISKRYLQDTGQKFESIAAITNTDGRITSSYGIESPIKRNLTTTAANILSNFYNIDDNIVQTNFQTTLLTTLNLTSSALQNVARKYTTFSDHFIFRSSSVRSRDLVTDSNSINFITIPNMYYGSTIKKGSVELNYYITGSKIATCADTNHNGTLIGTLGATLGSVVGLVLYDEGVIMLTSSISLETGPAVGIRYNDVDPLLSSWQYYGTTLGDGFSNHTLASASYDLNFKGTNYVSSMTMFAHANKGQLNHSNNPTYRNLNTARVSQTGSGLIFSEGPSDIANIVSGSFVSASFDKTTYISKVHIYDQDGNLIGITSLSKPVKKTLTDEFTFKMKLDL